MEEKAIRLTALPIVCPSLRVGAASLITTPHLFCGWSGSQIAFGLYRTCPHLQLAAMRLSLLSKDSGD
jgi:hypothetical protein